MHTGLLELPGAQTCMSRQNSPIHVYYTVEQETFGKV